MSTAGAGEGLAAPPSQEDITDILAIRQRPIGSLTRHQRFLERMTTVVGRPASLYLIVACAATWVVCNAFWGRIGLPGAALDPPPFVDLELAISFAALVATVAILTTQSRQNQSAEERAHLELQINLLAERKIAKLIALMEELRVDLPNVPNRVDPVADGMKESVDPHAILDALGSPKPAAPDLNDHNGSNT